MAASEVRIIDCIEVRPSVVIEAKKALARQSMLAEEGHDFWLSWRHPGVMRIKNERPEDNGN